MSSVIRVVSPDAPLRAPARRTGRRPARSRRRRGAARPGRRRRTRRRRSVAARRRAERRAALDRAASSADTGTLVASRDRQRVVEQRARPGRRPPSPLEGQRLDPRRAVLVRVEPMLREEHAVGPRHRLLAHHHRRGPRKRSTFARSLLSSPGLRPERAARVRRRGRSSAELVAISGSIHRPRPAHRIASEPFRQRGLPSSETTCSPPSALRGEGDAGHIASRRRS